MSLRWPLGSAPGFLAAFCSGPPGGGVKVSGYCAKVGRVRRRAPYRGQVCVPECCAGGAGVSSGSGPGMVWPGVASECSGRSLRPLASSLAYACKFWVLSSATRDISPPPKYTPRRLNTVGQLSRAFGVRHRVVSPHFCYSLAVGVPDFRELHLRISSGADPSFHNAGSSVGRVLSESEVVRSAADVPCSRTVLARGHSCLRRTVRFVLISGASAAAVPRSRVPRWTSRSFSSGSASAAGPVVSSG